MLHYTDICSCCDVVDGGGHEPECRITRLGKITELVEVVLAEGGHVAGGVCRSMIDLSAINDIDIFGKDSEHLSKIMDAVGLYLKNNNYVFTVAHNEKCDTITPQTEFPKIQFIKTRYADTLEDLLRQFPFSVCCVGFHYEEDNGELYFAYIDDTYDDILARRLVYVTSTDNEAVGTLYRFGYYQSLGYRPTVETLRQVAGVVRAASNELLESGLSSLIGRLEGSY